MAKLFIILCAFILTIFNTISAQNELNPIEFDEVVIHNSENTKVTDFAFGSEGSSWEYCLMVSYEGEGSVFVGYKVHHVGMESERNLLEIYDNELKKPIDTLQVFEQDSILYIYDKDTTVVFFDYTLKVGDTFVISLPKTFNHVMYDGVWPQTQFPDILESEDIVIIDDITITEINGVELKQWHFKHHFNPVKDRFVMYFNSFTERLGYNKFILPIISIGFAEFNPTCNMINYDDGHIQYQYDGVNKCQTVSTNVIHFGNVSIFPNPTQGLLVIDFETAISGQLTILDSTGQTVSSSALSFTNNIKLDLASYQSGIYILEVVKDGGERFVERIVINE